MGNTTDFVGHIDIVPALNEAEIDYLTDLRLPGQSDPSEGLGQLTCRWVPRSDGARLDLEEGETLRDPVEWLRYVIKHLLKPGAVVPRRESPAFQRFTFDHRLSGLVVGCRSDTQELFAIQVNDNRVTGRILWPGSQARDRREPLADDGAIVVRETTRRRRRPVASEARTADVIDLAARRARA